jgi:hypothetical protein
MFRQFRRSVRAEPTRVRGQVFNLGLRRSDIRRYINENPNPLTTFVSVARQSVGVTFRIPFEI